MVFRSRIDRWLAAVLIFGMFISLGAASGLLLVDAPGGLTVSVILILLGAVLPLWIMLSTHYTIIDTELRIVSGPFRWNIPLSEIHSITTTRNPLSSPALSLDRLRIEYGRGKWIMVSPWSKERFLKQLKEHGAGF